MLLVSRLCSHRATPEQRAPGSAQTFARHSTCTFAPCCSGVLLLMTNFVLALWVMALRGGHVWRRPPTSSPSAAPVAHEELSMA